MSYIWRRKSRRHALREREAESLRREASVLAGLRVLRECEA